MFDIDQGKDQPTLLRNTRLRFSNGNTVKLDEREAAAVLDAVRETYRESKAT